MNIRSKVKVTGLGLRLGDWVAGVKLQNRSDWSAPQLFFVVLNLETQSTSFSLMKNFTKQPSLDEWEESQRQASSSVHPARKICLARDGFCWCLFWWQREAAFCRRESYSWRRALHHHHHLIPRIQWYIHDWHRDNVQYKLCEPSK